MPSSNILADSLASLDPALIQQPQAVVQPTVNVACTDAHIAIFSMMALGYIATFAVCSDVIPKEIISWEVDPITTGFGFTAAAIATSWIVKYTQVFAGATTADKALEFVVGTGLGSVAGGFMGGVSALFWLKYQIS